MKLSSRSWLAVPAVTITGIALTSLAFTPQMDALKAAPAEITPAVSKPNAPKIAPLRVLVLGGGPNLDNNQVAIESNVRYLNRLLPANTPRTVLFADGNLKSKTVLYDRNRGLTRGQYLYELIFQDEGPQEIVRSWRVPQLGSALDGASRKAEITRAFTKIAHLSSGNAPRPILLYSTGHGSQNQANSDDNFYDLWNDEQLSVRDLAAQIARLPKKVPVNLVMVQCFSGAFANLIFEGGDSKNSLSARDIAGFFAATRTRMAAGCTSEVDETEYHDFTSYFFAALCGRDRVGRPVTGADFNRDGRVGMDEAFYYTIANDESIDTPISTSDLFLRHFVSRTATSTRYSTILAAASPAQRAALVQLSEKLKLSGENRVAQAKKNFAELSSGESSPFARVGEEIVSRAEIVRAGEKLANLRHHARVEAFAKWPDLQRKDADARRVARFAFAAQLEREQDLPKWKTLKAAGDELLRLHMEKAREDDQKDKTEARLIRFVNLHDSVDLRVKLQKSTNVALKARFARLLRQESSTLLPPVAPETTSKIATP